jgi:hypothetical protein
MFPYFIFSRIRNYNNGDVSSQAPPSIKISVTLHTFKKMEKICNDSTGNGSGSEVHGSVEGETLHPVVLAIRRMIFGPPQPVVPSVMEAALIMMQQFSQTNEPEEESQNIVIPDVSPSSSSPSTIRKELHVFTLPGGKNGSRSDENYCITALQ